MKQLFLIALAIASVVAAALLVGSIHGKALSVLESKTFEADLDRDSILRVQDIAYGDHAAQTYDVYYREEDQDAPVVFLVHGGSKELGGKYEMHRRIPMYLELGFTVVNTNFRYANDGFEYDLACSLATFKSEAGEYGASSESFMLHGYSLGGSISSRYAYDSTKDWLSDCAVKDPAVIAGYYGEATHYGNVIPEGFPVEFGLLDKEIIGPADFLEEARLTYDDQKGELEGGVRDGAINYIDANDPPALLIVGSEDPKNDEQRQEDFAEGLRAVGVPSYTLVIEGGDHGLMKRERPEMIHVIQDYAKSLFGGEDFYYNH